MCVMGNESPLPDIALQMRVRERIEAGLLPVMLAKHIFAGYGEGNLCLACDQPITPKQIEYEVDQDFNGAHYRLRLHLGCHVFWQLECHKRLSP